MLGELAGRPAAMVTFLEGVWMRRPKPAHCRAVGAAMAQMHLAGGGFAMTRRNGLTLEDWRPLWEQCVAAHAGMNAELAVEVEALLADLEGRWPRDLPVGTIHADLFPANVFFLGDALSGILDV